ncbi:MAG: response regulator [Desulfobacteraceae bacterium]|nr:response regulator [Desulfobacteraceae bacterium]
MDNLAKDVIKMGLLGAKEHTEEATQFLGMTQRFAETVALYPDPARVCANFARIIIEETGFENCSILFWDQSSGKLVLIAAYGLEDQLEGTSHQYRSNLRISSGKSMAGQAFSSGTPVFIGNTAEQPIPELEGSTIMPVSLVCLPLLELGVLNLSAYHPQSFAPHVRHNWEIVSNIIAHLLLGLDFERRAEGETVSKTVPLETAAPPKPVASSQISDEILDCLPQGICILDPEGNIVRVNRSIEKIQGEKLSEIIGRSPAVLFQDPSLFAKLLERVSDSDAGQVEKGDVNLMNSSGEAYVANINIARLGPPGTSGGYLLVIEDITKKKAFSEKIIQSEKLAALGTMAGGVSHDFNNLLMAILGHIQLILPQIEDEDIRRRLQNIEKAVYDGSNTVRRLQRFTERERDPKALASTIDIEEAVKDVVELTRPRWKNFMERSGHRIDMQFDLDKECMAAINASDLREVLTNLLLNAIDAMPQGGTITFRSRCHGEQVILEVADTGLGMTREVAEKIFDPFFTTKGVGNSGLGLSVSWSLIGRYGGDIQVKSKLGHGTTFVIKLTRAEAAKSQSVAKSGEGSSSYRLLLVDDDPEILNILRDMLRLKGHKVVATSDGEKALALLGSTHFDLVITDLGMPVVSGWEIARQAKEKDRNTPVVMITGWGAQYEDEDLGSRGVDLMLAKPLSWDKLLSSIEKML